MESAELCALLAPMHMHCALHALVSHALHGVTPHVPRALLADVLPCPTYSTSHVPRVQRVQRVFVPHSLCVLRELVPYALYVFLCLACYHALCVPRALRLLCFKCQYQVLCSSVTMPHMAFISNLFPTRDLSRDIYYK